jgi:hypothetical protein
MEVVYKYLEGGVVMEWDTCLRHYARSLNVADSIPDEVIRFFQLT